MHQVPLLPLRLSMICKVCGNRVSNLLDLSYSQQVTSLGRLLLGQASIYRCEECTHCQTDTDINLSEYYANNYKTLMNTLDEDDVYKITNDQIIWRADHMAQTFIKKLDLLMDYDNLEKIRFLDFGTGKGLFPKKVAKLHHGLTPYLYDISEDYTIAWSKFCESSHYSCFSLPDKWHFTFDVVSSMFSLEHVADPIKELQRIAMLLKPGGFLYIVVPNMYSENIFDMVVVDHIQHYSPLSMHAALNQAGLTLIHQDHTAHDQASIYIAQKEDCIMGRRFDGGNQKEYLALQDQISLVFTGIVDKVIQFAKSSKGAPIVIVGAGIIGTFIKSILEGKYNVALFVDSNVYKQAKGWNSLRVIPPSELVEYEELNKPRYIIAHNPKMISMAIGTLPGHISKDRILSIF